jgi:hypothetical protein
VTIDKALGLLDGFGIIGANQRLRADKMSVGSDGKCPVFYHPRPFTTGVRNAHMSRVANSNRLTDLWRRLPGTGLGNHACGPAAAVPAQAIGDPPFLCQRSDARRRPTAAGLLPDLENSIDLIFDQPDGSRPTYRTDSGFASAVAKPEFPAPSAAIRQLNDGIFDAFIFHKISSHTTPAKAERASPAREITTE